LRKLLQPQEEQDFWASDFSTQVKGLIQKSNL
jgi:hypothetical protein